MKRKSILRCFLAPAVIVSLLYTDFSRAQLSGSSQDQANIGLGAAVSDAEVLNFLQQHDVVPQAVFIWTTGFTGTHRTYKAKSAEAFLQEARAKTIESFEKSLQYNVIPLRQFVARYTEEEVLANEYLQQQARSLLNLRAAFEAVIAAAKRGEPLLYSLEVSGNTASIERLRGDPMVKVFQRAVMTGGRIVTPQTPKPQAYEKEFLDPAVQAMSGQEVYRQIQTLATTDAKESER